ncbi:MAG: type II CRISPR RNA-guided endonuclease Cas9, partial [Mycoplasmoidaceae bacterium]
MKKINIGLDIGITSVGWAIVDENYKILDAGVRLFDDVLDGKGKLKNVKRREARSLRRQIRRTRNRKDDLINFFIAKGIVKDSNDFYEKINKPFIEFNVSTMSELKEKMLSEKLDNNALVFVLFNYIHNRGYFYKENENDAKEKNPETSENKNIIFEKTNDFPSIQLNKFYKKYGFYKGSELSRNFSNSDWKNEIIHLLKTQKKDNTFVDEYMELLTRFRKYSEGPGSQKSPSEYGLWKINPETKEVFKDGDNLWDNTIGKCTIYPDIIRGMKNSPMAEIFNILNDINNIHFDKKREKLSKEEKIKLFDKFSLDLDGKKINSITGKLISKTLDLKLEDISGWIEDKKVSLKNYILIAKWLIQNKIYNGQKNLLNLDLLEKCNNIFNDLTKIKDVEEQSKKLANDFPESTKESIEELLKKISGLSATHSFSYKAMLEYIKIGIEQHVNQQEVFSDKILENRKNKFNTSGKYITRNLFDEEIISPTAKRSF